MNDEPSGKRTRRGWSDGVGIYVPIGVLILGWVASLFLHGAWARPLQKAYLITAGLLGVLFYAYWPWVKRLWFWKGLATVIPAHAAIVFAVIRCDIAFPWMDKLPGAVYGLLFSLVYGEWYISNRIVEMFRHRSPKPS